MPSLSLRRWQNDRQPRLLAVDHHCTASANLVPANVLLAEESLRSFAKTSWSWSPKIDPAHW